MKKCSKCGMEKDESEFYKSKRGKNGLMAHCKQCNYDQIKAKKRYKENQGAVKEKAKSYYLENRSEVLKRMKKYREENRETINAKAREYFDSKYGIDEEWTRKFKERQMKSYTEVEWQELLEKENNACSKCGTRINIVPNFIRPLSKNGSKDIANVQPLCVFCDKAKGDFTIDYRRNK